MKTVELHGLGAACRVSIVGSGADELADAVCTAWSRCHSSSGDEIDAGVVTVGFGEPGEDLPDCDLTGFLLEPAMQQLTQRVTVRNITAQTGRLLMLHAGALADPLSGEAIAFVAKGGTGKTTLTTMLGTRLGYLTDETVGFDAFGSIRPYPKPLSVRRGFADHNKRELSPDDLGLLDTPRDARLRRIVLLDRRDEHGAPVFTALDTVTAITALVPESSAFSEFPRPLRTLAELLDTLPPVVRLTYSEASEAADGLLGLLGER